MQRQIRLSKLPNILLAIEARLRAPNPGELIPRDLLALLSVQRRQEHLHIHPRASRSRTHPEGVQQMLRKTKIHRQPRRRLGAHEYLFQKRKFARKDVR